MTENSEEKTQEIRSENAPTQQYSQNDDTYFPYTHQPQKEERGGNAEIEEKRGEIENKFNEFLQAIRRESTLLNESLTEEKELTDELCILLTRILRRLKISFDIPPTYLENVREAKRIKLNSEGHLIVIGGREKVDSRLLQNYSPDIILKVMWVIIPEFERAIKTYRDRISKRVSLLEKMKQELKNIQKAFSPDEKENLGQPRDEVRRPLIAGESRDS